MSDLRQAASFALTTLQGWSNHDHWLWPQSALAQAKQNTTEAISLLEVALAKPEPEKPTPSDEELMALAVTVFEDPFATDVHYARAVLARWGHAPGPQPLSPAAQAVLDAVVPYPIHEQAIANELEGAGQ